MDRSSRTRLTALIAFGMAICLVGAACGSPEPAPSELVLTVREEGPPTLNGEAQPVGRMMDTLRASTQPITVRLPPGVGPDSLWELFELLGGQLPEMWKRDIVIELPRASGEGFERFSEPPVFLVLSAAGDVLFSTDAFALYTLDSVDEVMPVAAAEVARDPDARFLLTVEAGAPADLRPQVMDRLERMMVRNLMLFDDTGVRPLPVGGDDI